MKGKVEEFLHNFVVIPLLPPRLYIHQKFSKEKVERIIEKKSVFDLALALKKANQTKFARRIMSTPWSVLLGRSATRDFC